MSNIWFSILSNFNVNFLASRAETSDNAKFNPNNIPVHANFKLDAQEKNINLTFCRGATKNECIDYLKIIQEKIDYAFFIDNKHKKDSCYIDSFPFVFDERNLKFDELNENYYYTEPINKEILHNFSSIKINSYVMSTVQSLLDRGIFKVISSEKVANKELYASCISFLNRKYLKDKFTKFFEGRINTVCDEICTPPTESELFHVDGNKLYIRHFSNEVTSAHLQFSSHSMFSHLASDSTEHEKTELLTNLFIDSIYKSTGIIVHGFDRVPHPNPEYKDIIILVPFIKYNDNGTQRKRQFNEREVIFINQAISGTGKYMEFISQRKGSNDWGINTGDDEKTLFIVQFMIENSSIHPQKGLNIELDQQKHKQLKVSNNASTSRSESGYGSSNSSPERSSKVNTLPNVREESDISDSSSIGKRYTYDHYRMTDSSYDPLGKPSTNVQQTEVENVKAKNSWLKCIIL